MWGVSLNLLKKCKRYQSNRGWTFFWKLENNWKPNSEYKWLVVEKMFKIILQIGRLQQQFLRFQQQSD